MTIFGKAGKAYNNNFKYRLLKLNKFEQFVKLNKIQLSNTKKLNLHYLNAELPP